MNELRASIELNVPAVHGGARPRKGDPYFRLRPSSVRGGLRYWFRAAAASMMWPEHGRTPEEQRRRDNEMLAKLRALEAWVFGDTTARSKVVVLPPEGGSLSQWDLKSDKYPGLHYLGYGLFNGKPECLMTQPGRPITLRLVLRQDSLMLRSVVAASLWLWTNLGGLGSRSRRGYGSMRLIELTGDSEEFAFGRLSKLPDSHQGRLEQIQRGLSMSQDVLDRLARMDPAEKGVLAATGHRPHPYVRTLEGIASLRALASEHDDPLDALEYAGNLFRKYRSSLERKQPLPDYHAVKQSLEPPFRAPPMVERTEFGLPLNFYFRSLDGKKVQFLPRGPAGHEALDRVASPLLFRVHTLHKPNGKRCHGVTLINLAGKNASALQGCTLRSSRSGDPIAAPSASRISEFIETAVEESKQFKPPSPRQQKQKRYSRKRR